MEFFEVLARRHSVRKFADKPVGKDMVDRLIEAAGTAPSSKNCRSSAFMCIDEKDVISAISEMRDRGSAFVKDAPEVIVVLLAVPETLSAMASTVAFSPRSVLLNFIPWPTGASRTRSSK